MKDAMLLPARAAASARERIVTVAQTAPTPQALFAEVSAAVRAVVPADASGWFGVDPNSLLPTWPARIENVAPGACGAYWEREFLTADALSVRELATTSRTTGGLHAELDGLMNRSARYREFMAPRGYHDELRSALRTGNSTWGIVVLLRGPNLPPFSEDEIRFVAGLSQPLAEALRAKVLTNQVGEQEVHGAGILSYDLEGRLVAASDDALYWLDQLPNSAIEESAPVAISTALAHVRAVEAGLARGDAGMLLPSRSGQWLTVRGSALRGPTGEPRAFAVTIEPTTRKQLTPLLAEAYGLSRRELEVTIRLARGEATAAIAQALFLSEHTVRDHVKSVLTKTGVSSRAALISHLFFDQLHPVMVEDAVHL